ncbi:DUF3624 domain-containing protein [Dongshaea marina]|uniref:DUF3624 domain-containing protein n=1 Tax=Dongshaea marina TaxID=2047966 RepID=UPI000D3E106B|nr:DUF3624 domain-containing protein [Dongshaea marina]
MSCRYCLSDLFREKLGRCRACMLQCLVGSLICWGLFLWQALESMTSVEAIAALMFAILFSLLLLAHGIAWCWYRLRDRSSPS